MSSSPEIRKLYYSIGEVAAIIGEETHVLRHWEDEFEQLTPRRKSGRRIYTKDDLAVVTRIWHLLKVDKYTQEGAKRVLEREGIRDASGDLRKDLRRLRGFLENILKQLEVD